MLYEVITRFPGARAVELIRFDALDACLPAVDAGTPVVVMTHHFLHDVALLRHLLPGAAPYVGLLGPRQRARNLLEELERQGVRPSSYNFV